MSQDIAQANDDAQEAYEASAAYVGELLEDGVHPVAGLVGDVENPRDVDECEGGHCEETFTLSREGAPHATQLSQHSKDW